MFLTAAVRNDDRGSGAGSTRIRKRGDNELLTHNDAQASTPIFRQTHTHNFEFG